MPRSSSCTPAARRPCSRTNRTWRRMGTIRRASWRTCRAGSSNSGEHTMIILINTPLSPEHRAQIQAVSEQLELVGPAGRDALLAAAARAEVIFWGVDRDLLAAAPPLRWV